jgi:flagellar basal body-associated protein FliL
MKQLFIHIDKVTLRHKITILLALCLFASFQLSAQVRTSVDTTRIKIGGEVVYKIEVETDTTKQVVFPESQTFLPFEVIEFYNTDTVKKDDKFQLIKKYGLTSFDSGWYQIPRQKILINEQPFFSDSLYVYVQDVVVDTTKQKLFDIKPIIEVQKPKKNWWSIVLIVLIILAIVTFLIYWFIWRKKPLTEAERIAQLPPFERAKAELKNLENSRYLIEDKSKDYYSELTRIIRSFIDEKVYDKALESTTAQLIERLELLSEAKEFSLKKETINQIDTIFRRADLAKFAKQQPEMVIAETDLKETHIILDEVNKLLPEPSEEEKLLDEAYRKAQEQKAKRKKIMITAAIVLFLMIATIVGFGLKYGFVYIKDVVFQNSSLELLEGEWVDSEYGMPPISISTPQVLMRMDAPVPEELKDKMQVTAYGYELKEKFTIALVTTNLVDKVENFDLSTAVEGSLQTLEARGIEDIITLNEMFKTPNGAEGLKTYGTLKVPNGTSGNFLDGKYVMLSFSADDKVIQQITLVWGADDTYADDIANRIINSIELQPKELQPKSE